jgi:hypothetical protein
MPSVQENLENGMELKVENGRVFAKRVFFVKDLAGSASTPMGMLYVAVTLGGIPNQGDPLEGVPGNAGMVRKTVTPWPPYDAAVVCEYESPPDSTTNPGGGNGPGFVIEGGFILEGGETEKDSEGKAFSVNYTPPGGFRNDPAREQGGLVPTFQPKGSLRISFTKKTSLEELVKLRKAVRKKRNKSTFLRVFEAGTLLCMAVTWQAVDGKLMQTFNITIELAEDVDDKWEKTLRWIDPTTGKPPVLTDDDVKAGNGVKKVQPFKDADYDEIVRFANEGT